MAKKIDRDAAAAFLRGEKFSRSNTYVAVEDGEATMVLFGHEIATHDLETGGIQITLAGKPTLTTRARLNAICRGLFPDVRCGVYQQDWDQYFFREDETEMIEDCRKWITIR